MLLLAIPSTRDAGAPDDVEGGGVRPGRRPRGEEEVRAGPAVPPVRGGELRQRPDRKAGGAPPRRLVLRGEDAARLRRGAGALQGLPEPLPVPPPLRLRALPARRRSPTDRPRNPTATRRTPGSPRRATASCSRTTPARPTRPRPVRATRPCSTSWRRARVPRRPVLLQAGRAARRHGAASRGSSRRFPITREWRRRSTGRASRSAVSGRYEDARVALRAAAAGLPPERVRPEGSEAPGATGRRRGVRGFEKRRRCGNLAWKVRKNRAEAVGRGRTAASSRRSEP